MPTQITAQLAWHNNGWPLERAAAGVASAVRTPSHTCYSALFH